MVSLHRCTTEAAAPSPRGGMHFTAYMTEGVLSCQYPSSGKYWGNELEQNLYDQTGWGREYSSGSGKFVGSEEPGRRPSCAPGLSRVLAAPRHLRHIPERARSMNLPHNGNKDPTAVLCTNTCRLSRGYGLESPSVPLITM